MNIKDERKKLEDERKKLEDELYELGLKEERVKAMWTFRNAECEEHDWVEHDILTEFLGGRTWLFATVEIEVEMRKTEGGETVLEEGSKSVTRFCTDCGREETYSFELKLMGEPVMSDPYADIREYQLDEGDEE